MGRHLGTLLALSAVACVACGFTPTSSASPATASPAATATIMPTPTPSPTPVPTPTPPPTPAPPVAGWTTRAVAVEVNAGDVESVQVHLGANFPIVLTNRKTPVESEVWYEAMWETPGRSGVGWLPEKAITLTKPAGQAVAGFDALDESLEEFLESYGTRVGVAVFDVTRGMHYAYNADRPYFVASSIKVPIMMTLLSQLEARKRQPNATELALLKAMIEYSDNEAANKLYVEVGYQRGIAAYLKKLGIASLKVADDMPWGYSTFTPAAMVTLLTRLHNGTTLNASDRALALNLMRHVTPGQRTGVGDSSPSGATVAMKDGWINAPAPGGPNVANSSGIVTLGDETYVISVYTDRDPTTDAGFKIIRHVCKVVGEKLTAKPAVTPPTPLRRGPAAT